MSETQNLTKKRWTVLVISCIINIMIGTGYAWSMFVAPLNEHFIAIGYDAAMATLTWAFTLANSIGPIPMIIGGFINDNIGPKWSVFIGGIFFGGGVFVAGCATSPIMVVVGYGILMGLGMGLVYGCTIGNSVKFFPDKAGLVGGLTTATYGLGSVILPLIIKNIVNPDTVLGTFKVLGIIYLVVICVGAFFITRCPVGFVPDGYQPPAPKAGVKAPESKNWKQMLADPIFWVMMVMMMCGATFGLMMISNCRGLITALGAEVTLAATAVTTLALFNAIGRVVCGWISDKLGRVNTLTAMICVGIIGLVIVSVAKAPNLFIVGICLVGLAFGSFMGVYPGFCAEQFGPKNNGVNYGIMFIGFALAGIVGPQILQKLGTPTAYYVAIGLGVLGLIMSFAYRAMSKSK
ncbi:MAG: OFA family MFS transporter [Firmicutes bacterium]|nr:OFA family MFS transporter [Bacillota bacterium]